jgi:superfamily II helicase
VAITDKIYFNNHRKLSSQLDTHVPRAAFSGAALDTVFTGNIDNLDDDTRDKIIAFASDFLDCSCTNNPYCGHPETKFTRYLLELRTDGFSPTEIIDIMTADYGLYAYPGDILSFLDTTVRTLEAAEELAAATNNSSLKHTIETHRKSLL